MSPVRRARGRGASKVSQDVRAGPAPADAASLAAHDEAERLRVAQSARAQLLHDAEVGFWRYDPDAETYYFGSELSLGHAGIGEPVTVEALQLLQHQDDRAKDTEIRERLTREGGAAESEMRYRNAAGGWTHLRVRYRSGRRLPSGLYEMYGLSQSVTALAEARDSANASAQRLGLALKASRAGVFEYDFRTEAFWVSPELNDLVGPQPDQSWQENPLVLFHPDDRALVAEFRKQVISGEGADPVDLRLPRQDGEIWVRLFLEVERGRDGRARRGVGLVMDIDETKRQELALIEARRIAEAATAAKSNFLASVSHEIRTPMNGVVGVLNLLRRELLSTEGTQLLDEALGCAEMLSQLINDVLDLSKIEAGKLGLAPQPTDVAALARSVVGLIRPQATEKRLDLALELPHGEAWACIDPVRLRQCLFNLIGNAVKFTDRGGVTVRLAWSGEGAARRLRCEVEDTGVGVPEVAKARLFNRFEQAEGGAARRFGGAGLGLAISRQLARMMGGDLDFTSREGAGSTFWFEIEAPPAERGAAAAEIVASAPLAGLTVLIVDDNRVNRIVAGKTLEAMGAMTEAVESGAAAIEAVGRGAFDIVLMDVNMPEMDGLEATRRIRALGGETARVPVIALTADVMRHQREACLAAGMDGVATKPFSPAELVAEIARLAAGGLHPVSAASASG